MQVINTPREAHIAALQLAQQICPDAIVPAPGPDFDQIDRDIREAQYRNAEAAHIALCQAADREFGHMTADDLRNLISEALGLARSGSLRQCGRLVNQASRLADWLGHPLYSDLHRQDRVLSDYTLTGYDHRCPMDNIDRPVHVEALTEVLDRFHQEEEAA